MVTLTGGGLGARWLGLILDRVKWNRQPEGLGQRRVSARRGLAGVMALNVDIGSEECHSAAMTCLKCKGFMLAERQYALDSRRLYARCLNCGFWLDLADLLRFFHRVLQAGEKDFESGATIPPVPPASLTKIMSAIVILSEGNLDDAVRISSRAAAAAPTKLHLKAGQLFPLRGLLEGMLIRSANDACLAAAEHIAGTEAAFVQKMNAKAKELGLVQTQFQNACGFNMDRHYSTAEELARLTEYAMRYDTFSTIVKEPMVVLRPVNQSKVLVAHTTNHLLGVMDGVIGVKTGYTRAAGRCLIT